MITKKQMEYLNLYQSGATMREISERYGVNISTVSRVIARARKIKCPFSSDCKKCPLPDCIVKEKYAYMLNNTEDYRAVKRANK